MLFCENICYLCRTISFDCKLIYFSYNFCCFFIDQQMVFIFWIMLIPIRNCTTASLARFHSGLKNSFDFLACVLCIPFIHDIQKWCKIIIRWCCTVNTVVDCNETVFLYNIRLSDNFFPVGSYPLHKWYQSVLLPHQQSFSEIQDG